MSLEIIQLNSVNYVPTELLERLEALTLKHEVADILVPSASHIGHAQKAIATRGAGIGAGVMVYTPSSYVAKYWPLITDGTQIATKAQIEVYAAQALEEARKGSAAAAKDSNPDGFIYHINKIGVIAEILMSTTLERIEQVLDGRANSTSSNTLSSVPCSVSSTALSSIPSKTPDLGAFTENEGIIISVARDTLKKLHEAHFITQEEAASRLAHNQEINLPPLFITGFEQADENLVRFIKALADKIPVIFFVPGTEAGRILGNALCGQNIQLETKKSENTDEKTLHQSESWPLPRLVFLEPLGPSAEAESIACYLKAYTNAMNAGCRAEGMDGNDVQNATSVTPKNSGANLAGTSRTQPQRALVVTVDPERAWRTLAPKLADTIEVHASWSKPLLSCKPVALFLRFVEQLWDIIESQKKWDAFAAQWKGIGEWEAFVARWKDTAEKKTTKRKILQAISDDYAALPSTWWPPTDIVDFLHSSLSPFEAQDVDAFDASMRSRRNLTPGDVLKGLNSLYRGFSGNGQASLQDEEAQCAGAGDESKAKDESMVGDESLTKDESVTEEERTKLRKVFDSMSKCLLSFDLKGAIEAVLPIAATDNSKEALQGMSKLYSLMLAVELNQMNGTKETPEVAESAEEDYFSADETRRQKAGAKNAREVEARTEEARAKEAHRQLELLKAMARNASMSYSYQADPSIKTQQEKAISPDLEDPMVTVDIVSYNSAQSILPRSYDICVLADQGMEAQTARMYLTSVERLINEKLGDAEQVPREIVSAAKNEQLYAIAREHVAFEKPQKTDEGREVYPSPLLSSVEAAFIADSNGSNNTVTKEDASGKNAPVQKDAFGKETLGFGKETAVPGKGTSVSDKETKDTGKDALEIYKQELAKMLGPWVQQSEEHVRQNYLARDNNQTPQEYPFEENIQLTGKAKDLLGHARVRDKESGEVSLTEEVRLSPTSLEALNTCPRRWFFERGLSTKTIDAEMDPLAKGTLYHDVLSHVLERATSAQGEDYKSEGDSGRYADLFDEVWTKRFAQAIALAGGADINLSDKDAAELDLMNKIMEQADEADAPAAALSRFPNEEAPKQSESSSVQEKNTGELFKNFYKFLPKNLQEAQIVRDMDQNLHRLLESGEVFVEGFQPAFFEYPFDSTTERDRTLTYAGIGQKGSIDRIDIDENGNVLIIDYKSSKKTNLAQYKLGVDENNDSIKTESYLHPQTFIYAKVINKLKPHLLAELDASALPHALKKKLKQKELRVVGVLYLGVADWQAFYGCAEEGALPAQITQGSASKNITQISHFDSLVDDFEANLSELVKERIGKGVLPPQPLANNKDVCTYCAFKYKCAFDMKKKEAEIEKYEQWSQLHGEKDAEASAATGAKTSAEKSVQGSAQGESNA